MTFRLVAGDRVRVRALRGRPLGTVRGAAFGGYLVVLDRMGQVLWFPRSVCLAVAETRSLFDAAKVPLEDAS